jgi:hypothetical protein
MSANCYLFEVIDANGCCEPVADLLATDMTAVFDKVTEISAGIAQPGYRIRVRDSNGNAVFVGITTRQGAGGRDDQAACIGAPAAIPPTLGASFATQAT